MQTGKLPATIAVLMGGISSERDVSLQSGSNIASLLETQGFNVIRADVTPDNLSILDDHAALDVFLLAVHGTWVEDGQIQKILEDKKLRYTGSSSAASRLAFDKIQTKNIFTENSILVPGGIDIETGDDISKALEMLKGRTGKFVVKPSSQGSSVGVEIVTGADAAVRSAQRSFEKYGPTLIENFIQGRELTVGIVNGKPLPLIEICPHGGFYDYSAKYISEQTQYLFDTIQNKNIVDKIMDDSVRCFNAVGARHLARVDFMLDDNGRYYALEINTLPGFTSHSLLPKAALKAGYTQAGLCVEIVKAAMES